MKKVMGLIVSILVLVLSTSEVSKASLSYPRGASSSTGTWTAGTAATMSPVVVSTKVTQAHGLGAMPTFILAYMECLTAELGFSVGDRVYFQFADSTRGHEVTADATNVYILHSPANDTVINKTSLALAAITAANWKIVAIPYRIN